VSAPQNPKVAGNISESTTRGETLPEAEDIEQAVLSLMVNEWTIRQGRSIPATEAIGLKLGSGVEIECTFLYADLAESSLLGQTLSREDAAKVIKSFLFACSRLIKLHGGEVKSFDGDRVMGVFHGDEKEMRAVRAAFNIHWAVQELISDKASRWIKWPAGEKVIRHATGIATGPALMIRGGVRDSNDIASIGSAPNLAAKLSEIRGRRERTFIDTATWMKAYDDTDRDAAGQSLWNLFELIHVGGKGHAYRGTSTLRDLERRS
jgi:adenylate cyclase